MRRSYLYCIQDTESVDHTINDDKPTQYTSPVDLEHLWLCFISINPVTAKVAIHWANLEEFDLYLFCSCMKSNDFGVSGLMHVWVVADYQRVWPIIFQTALPHTM